jgi:hypothetical protein
MSAVNELAPLSGFVLPRPITLQGEDVHRMTFHLIFRGPRDAADPVVAELLSQEGGKTPLLRGRSSPPLSFPSAKTDLLRPYIFFQFFTVFFYIFGKKKGVQVLLKPGDIVKERR